MLQHNLKYIFLLNFITLLSISGYSSSTFDISDEDYLVKFGTQLEQSISNGNPYYFNLSFDGKTLVQNIIDESDKLQNKDFDKGFMNGFIQNLDFGVLLVDEINRGSSFTLVHTEKKYNTSTLTFRLVSYQGIDYHEYSVEQVQDKLKITDAYIYSTGQRISETVRALYKEYTTEIKVRDIKLEKTLFAIQKSSSEGLYKKAFRKWEQLPYGIQNEKMTLAQGIGSAVYVNDKSFSKALELFTLNYPVEPSKYFIPLKGLIAHKQYNTALEYIDTLDLLVDFDPMLNFLRANVHYEAGEYTKASKYLGELIESMPDFELGYLSLLEIYLEENKFEEATSLLNEMTLSFNSYKEDYIPLFSNFPEFINSAEYQNWMQ